MFISISNLKLINKDAVNEGTREAAELCLQTGEEEHSIATNLQIVLAYEVSRQRWMQ
jgi:hypothetical protein